MFVCTFVADFTSTRRATICTCYLETQLCDFHENRYLRVFEHEDHSLLVWVSFLGKLGWDEHAWILSLYIIRKLNIFFFNFWVMSYRHEKKNIYSIIWYKIALIVILISLLHKQTFFRWKILLRNTVASVKLVQIELVLLEYENDWDSNNWFQYIFGNKSNKMNIRYITIIFLFIT